ncbi:hypothetical protein WA026_003664 [Henosepilachna vigintioctopunctata]|uniref:Arginine/serine-rich protein PNISR n=1 Tax=Henosepilachna vigintioctopunctata TaxID=420089 RepID=A0AAW1UDW3_9CUCU
MYSGSDSTESANYGQWPLNPTFFQNMPNEQVDWAALAQQWIQMKEAGPPLPEPKPIEIRKESEKIEKEILPIRNDEGSANASWNNISSSAETFDNSWNWKAQQSWDWSNNWNAPVNPPPQIVTPSNKPTLLPTPKGYTSVDSSSDNVSVNSGFSTSRNNEFGTGFSGHSSNHSRHYKPHNRRYSKINIPKPITPTPLSIPVTSDIETSNLDASKRKQLPAWIREGLEKMERDKLKQMEKEKEREKQTVYSEKIKEQEKETMEILKDTIKERRRSKFDSDEEQSPKRLEVVKKESSPLSHDELMLLVRRTMTEILLKVTNEAIHTLCTEEYQRYIKRIQTFGKISGKANVSAKLGLGIYGSDSGSESDDSETSKRDSEDELKTVIRKRKAEFLQTEKGIEDKLLQAEQKKGNSKLKDDESEEDSSDNQLEDHSSPTKKEENINAKSKSHFNAKHRNSSHSSEESDKESICQKSSSRSSESTISARKKNRSRSRDRGYTPEKRHRHKSPKRSRSRSYERRHSKDYKNKKERNRSERSRRSRSRSRTSRRSRSRSSSYRSRRSSETSSRSRRKRSRSPKRSRRSRSKSYSKSSRTR